MADIEKTIKLGIDTGDSLSSLGKLKKELANLYVDLDQVDKGSAAFKKLDAEIKSTEKSVKKAEAAFGDASDKIRTLSGSGIEKVTASFGLLKEGLANLDFGKFKTGITGVAGSFKALGSAIAATGIGLLVTSVTYLIANFDELSKSGGLLGKVLSFIGDQIKMIIDGFEYLADKLGLINLEEQKLDKQREERSKKFIENEQNKKSAVEERYNNEIALAKSLGKNTDELEIKSLKAQKAVIDNQIERIKAFTETTSMFDNILKPLLDKLTKDQEAAAIKVKIKENEVNTERNENTLNFIKEESDALNKFNQSLVDEERKKFNDFQLIEAKAFDDKKKLEDEYNALSEKDKKDKLNAFNQAILDIDLKATRDREELKAKIIADNEAKKKDAHQIELDNLFDETEAEFMATSAKSEEEKKAADAKSEEEKKAADEQKKRDEETKQNRISTAWDTANALQSILSSFGEKNKKAAKAAFILQKGISAAQAGIATYEAANKAYSALAGIPVVGPGLGIAAAAAAVIAGGLNVKKILSQKFESTSPPTSDSTPSASTGASSLSGGAQSGPIAPPVFNLGGQQIGGASNMLGNNTSGGFTQQPIKVFVSETDISNVSKKVKVTEGNSLFGG